MNTPAPRQSAAITVENALIRGDLSGMNETERLEYYNQVCKSIGLNPLTRPFEYLQLQGKTILYARRDAADQLRKLNGISIEVLGEDYSRGMLSVHVRATDKDGRTDEDWGVVPWPEKIAAEFAANIKMKAVTKAKRRVTLSISGLGWLDENEVEDIPEAKSVPAPKKYRETESGPQMSMAEVNTIGSKLLRAMRSAETREQAQTCVDMVGSELERMEQTFPERHADLLRAIKHELAQFK